MRTVLALFSFLVLAGCSNGNNGGGGTTPIDVGGFNPVFQTYVDSFKAYAQMNGADMDRINSIQLGIDFGTLDSNYIGYCVTNRRQSKVTINKAYWDAAWFTEVDKRAVIIHELGHCFMFYGHTDTMHVTAVTDDTNTTHMKNIPTSIMNKTHVGLFFNANELNFLDSTIMPQYINELFNGVNSPIQPISGESGDILIFKDRAENYGFDPSDLQ